MLRPISVNKMMKKLTVAALLFLLAGCATQKKVIPFQYYNEIALREAVTDACVSQGVMDYQVAAAAKNFNAADLNSWQYDIATYQNAFSEAINTVRAHPPQKATCQGIIIGVMQRQQRNQQAYQQHQLELQQQQIFNQNMQTLQNSMPRTTYCNKIGSRTVCNTY